MARFRVTPRARNDLRAIGRYTLNKWGARQRDVYLRDLDKRFRGLAENPKMGKPRVDVDDEYHCYQQGAHLIFYTIHQDYIAIIGVPHQRMDVLNYFDSKD